MKSTFKREKVSRPELPVDFIELRAHVEEARIEGCEVSFGPALGPSDPALRRGAPVVDDEDTALEAPAAIDLGVVVVVVADRLTVPEVGQPGLQLCHPRCFARARPVVRILRRSIEQQGCHATPPRRRMPAP